MAIKLVSRFIKIKASFESIHCWKKAIKDVKFLRHPHRHVFGVEVQIKVFHDDREIEFILFKRFVQQIVDKLPKQSTLSCEQFSDIIAKKIHAKYPDRYLRIEVNEDFQEGSISEYVSI